MLDHPRRGKRGPAPSWQLGSTRAIRVPIVLADALLNLARRVDSGEVSLDEAYLSMSEQQVYNLPLRNITENKATKVTNEEQYLTKNNLANRSAVAKVRYAQAQANFIEAKIRFIQAQKTLFTHHEKPPEK